MQIINYIIACFSDPSYTHQIAYVMPDKTTINREFKSLQHIRDHHKKTVISLDDASFGNIDGIEHCLAWDVL